MISNRRGGGARPRHNQRADTRNHEENSVVDFLAELQMFDEFKQNIAPRLRAALNKGMRGEDIYKQFQDLAAARAVTIAVQERDSSKALAAVREILDRAEGKAVERKTVTHKLEELSDEQLDAVLLSELDGSEIKTTPTKLN